MKMPALFENNLRKIHHWQKALRSRGGCSHEIAGNYTSFGEMLSKWSCTSRHTQEFTTELIWKTMERWYDFILPQLSRQCKKIVISIW